MSSRRTAEPLRPLGALSPEEVIELIDAEPSPEQRVIERQLVHIHALVALDEVEMTLDPDDRHPFQAQPTRRIDGDLDHLRDVGSSQ